MLLVLVEVKLILKLIKKLLAIKLTKKKEIRIAKKKKKGKYMYIDLVEMRHFFPKILFCLHYPMVMAKLNKM